MTKAPEASGDGMIAIITTIMAVELKAAARPVLTGEHLAAFVGSRREAVASRRARPHCVAPHA